jgi:hypothetical protein
VREYHDTAEERAVGKIDLWMHWTLLALPEEESLIILEISWMVNQCPSVGNIFGLCKLTFLTNQLPPLQISTSLSVDSSL